VLDEAVNSDKFFVFMKRFENATDFVKVNVEYSRKKYIELMSKGIAKIFIAEENGELQGAIGFLISNDLHNGEKIGVETFWFVAPEFKGIGKDLFKIFEKEAIKSGCKKLAMIHLNDSYPKTLEKFYKSQGYKLLESHYIKEI
jgi:hypothetical protein